MKWNFIALKQGLCKDLFTEESYVIRITAAVRPKLYRLKSAHTLFKAIYIQGDVRPISHCALEKIIKTPKGGRKNIINSS